MKTIIDFIIDVEKNPVHENVKEFLNLVQTLESYKKLKEFFDLKGYSVSDEECIRILENSSKFPKQGPLKY